MSLNEIILFIVLFILSGFFSGSEIALMSLPKHKIESLLKSKRPGAKSLRDVKEDTDNLLIMILIGNNLVNTYTAALATQIAMSLSEKIGIGASQAVGISTVVVTIFLLLFGEIIPKSIASKNAVSIALFVSPIYKFLMVPFWPIIMLIKVVIRVFSGKKSDEKMTDDDIQSFIDLGRDHGGIDDDEHEKLKSVFEFYETTAEEIMTPRVKIEAIPDTLTIKEAVEYYLTHTHTRIPIYHETIDKIDYFISGRDLLRELNSGNSDKKLTELKLRKVLKVPLNQPISKLLDIFQKTNKIFAIIMDPYGGVAGLTSLEDIIEQVFGEIRDESDREAEEFVKIPDGKILTNGLVLMQDLLDEFELELPNIGLDEKEFNGETVSYVITDVLEGFPKSGEEIEFEIISDEEEKIKKKLYIKVLEADESKIGKVEARIESCQTENEKEEKKD
ncbi:hypothetical protein BLD25_04790 [Candidatus Gracilibacteria bacterium GN02-872]|nr:hypothetical protein BLD25_04790 [Candidatus Gracilibacteria bacterium GN02-872]